jgi:anti-anti-sigma factor
VVWLRGEHDVASKELLTEVLIRAVALGQPTVVIDMSQVQFISAASIGVIVRAKNVLRHSGRPLVLRAPSNHVRWVFGLCGLAGLFESQSSEKAFVGTPGAPALGSWVSVPATERDDGIDPQAKPVSERSADAAAGVPAERAQ